MSKPLASREARGYNYAHRRMRKQWEPLVAAGDVMCARQGPNCIGQPIKPGQAWDLGHDDDRTHWTGPECVPCNRGAGGRNGAAAVHQKNQTISRDW